MVCRSSSLRTAAADFILAKVKILRNVTNFIAFKTAQIIPPMLLPKSLAAQLTITVVDGSGAIVPTR